METRQLSFTFKKFAIFLKTVQLRENMSTSKVSKIINITYGHCVKTRNELISGDFLIQTKKGREKVLRLTEKGKKANRLLYEIMKLERDWVVEI